MQTTLDHLNRCAPDEFVTLVGPVFEHSPWIAAAAAATRPFQSREHLHGALCDVVLQAPEARQLELIRAHPDLVARGALSAESAREQAAAGLVGLDADEIARFDRYNTAYKARFGFPFVICARKHGKVAILDAFEGRLSNDRAHEIADGARGNFSDCIAQDPGSPSMTGGLTTHVLDLARGRPAAGMTIDLWIARRTRQDRRHQCRRPDGSRRSSRPAL